MNLNPIVRRATSAIARREQICFDVSKTIRGEKFRDRITHRVLVLAVAEEFAKRYVKWRRFAEPLNDAF